MTTVATQARTRAIIFKTAGMATSEGAGVNLLRMIGTPIIDMLDPFLMLDWFHSDDPTDYLAGIPDHPHRGFEAITFIVHGRMRHRDSKGHEGVIAPGGIQWMTAARGIIHSEMPEQEDGLLSGFQLWINLPAALKMAPAEYHEFDSDRIPVDQRDGARLRVFSGSTRTGVTGPVVGRATDPFYADIHLDPGAELRETLPAGHNAFIMVYDGAVEGPGEASPVAVTRGELAVLDRGDDVALTAGPDGASLLLVAARPLGEPVARAGPFVMNTKEEIYQAYADYRDGRM